MSTTTILDEVPAMSPSDEATAPPASKRFGVLRIVALVVLLGGAWLAADRFGLRESMTQDGIRQLMDDAGVWGALTYLAAFAFGQLVQIPGLAFVVAARVAYGPLLGFAAAYTGSLLSVSVSFVFVRTVGGKALTGMKWKWVQRVLAKLDERPVLTIIVLRTLFALSPPLNYALAMSSTRFRHYFLGSAIGLIGPVAVYVFLSDFLLSFTAGIF